MEHANANLQWTVVDGNTEIASPRNWDELAAVIVRLPEVASVPNAICCLVAPGGDVLSIGIAGRGDKDNPALREPVASVSFETGSGDPPYLAVMGDDSLDYESGGVVVFRYEDQWTEILRRNCVSLDIMKRIAKEFFETGKLPDWIEWEAV